MSILFLIHISLIYLMVFSFAWWIAKQRNDLSVIDWFWGIGAVICVFDGVFNLHEKDSKSVTLFWMGLLWGVRLTGFLIMRSQGKGEDKRYTVFRNEWLAQGKDVWKESYRHIFLLQAALNLVLCVPLWAHYSKGAGSWNIINFFGVLIFLAGFILETHADFVMYQFKKLKETQRVGDFCQIWPWNKARHPNYFGEMLVWWGIFLTAIERVSDIWMSVSPLLVMGLLMKVSGVPLIEKEMVKREGQENYFKANKFLPF